jgi:asparaginyl-tRNA synthetase
MDLQSEHERYITEKIVNGPVFLIDYPKELKAFYMYQTMMAKRSRPATCRALCRRLVGGSQREDRYDILRIKWKPCICFPIWVYLDLRKFGGCPHAGFGIGFDRLLMYITGINNIRDVQPYPRSATAIKY